jgi:tetratricopeptide (TPR) repeat protein
MVRRREDRSGWIVSSLAPVLAAAVLAVSAMAQETIVFDSGSTPVISSDGTFPPEPPPLPPPPPPELGGIVVSEPQLLTFEGQAEADFKAAKYEAAIRNWRHALVDKPDNGGVIILLAQAMFATGRYDEELALTEQAMKLLPQEKWGEVVTHYTELYRGNQDYTDQLRALEKARKAHDSPELRFLLAYHYGYLGYAKEAVRELDKALASAPDHPRMKQLREIFAKKLK